MKGGNKLWSTVVDYFLVLGAIIGVGFASGKEICVFFYDFGGASILGLIAFGLLYIYLFLVIQYVSNKLKLNSYNEFNTYMFGAFCKISKVALIINFVITSAGMLAGADYLFGTFFNIGYKIPSLVLSALTLFLLLGGINKIKIVANIIIPLMIGVIVINSLVNTTPENVNLAISQNNAFMAIYYGLLFGVNNFVAALPVLFETKLKTKGRLAIIFSICLIILLNILVFASNTYTTDMPMFELSVNVSKAFYYVYFITLIMALFSTLIICSYNTQKILSNFKNKTDKESIDKKNIFLSLFIVILNLIISNTGYSFIVKYLYVISGMISGIYVIILIVIMTIKLIRFKKKDKKS